MSLSFVVQFKAEELQSYLSLVSFFLSFFDVKQKLQCNKRGDYIEKDGWFEF